MTEADLCRDFIAGLPKEWTAYPETAGWDILLVRAADGFQIGVQAKLTLNAKVICQAAEDVRHWAVDIGGPDCRAVLVPHGKHRSDFAELLRLLGLVVLTFRADEDYRGRQHWQFWPCLPERPDAWHHERWPEFAPLRRHALPDYVPDVTAGASAPVALTPWKISAIKIVVLLERRGFVTRRDFAAVKMSMSRWTQGGWLIYGAERGQWIAGKLPDFRAQHPVNFEQIAADFDKWNPDAERKDAA